LLNSWNYCIYKLSHQIIRAGIHEAVQEACSEWQIIKSPNPQPTNVRTHISQSWTCQEFSITLLGYQLHHGWIKIKEEFMYHHESMKSYIFRSCKPWKWAAKLEKVLANEWSQTSWNKSWDREVGGLNQTESSFLRLDAVSLGEWLPTFKMLVVPSSSRVNQRWVLPVNRGHTRLSKSWGRGTIRQLN